MRTIIFTAMLLVVTSTANIFAQKANLDKLPENERNEYLLKKAYEAVMTYGPEWYRDYKEPEIKSFIIELGPDKGRLLYSVTYFYDPQKEKMEYPFAISVGIYADLGEVRGLDFGDGTIYFRFLNKKGDEKPFVRPCPYPRPQ